MSSTTSACGGAASRWKQAAYLRSSAIVSKYLAPERRCSAYTGYTKPNPELFLT